MDLKARDGSVEIPKSGVIVAGLTAPVAERRFTQGEFRGWSGNARVYFASNYGVMSYADGSFKAFPLETSNSFVVTNCAGSFVARAHRVAAAPSRVADVLRELNGVSAN